MHFVHPCTRRTPERPSRFLHAQMAVFSSGTWPRRPQSALKDAIWRTLWPFGHIRRKDALAPSGLTGTCMAGVTGFAGGPPARRQSNAPKSSEESLLTSPHTGLSDKVIYRRQVRKPGGQLRGSSRF